MKARHGRLRADGGPYVRRILDLLVGRASDWDPVQFHDGAKHVGVDALSLATLLLCAACEAPAVRVRLDGLAELIRGSCAATAQARRT